MADSEQNQSQDFVPNLESKITRTLKIVNREVSENDLNNFTKLAAQSGIKKRNNSIATAGSNKPTGNRNGKIKILSASPLKDALTPNRRNNSLVAGMKTHKILKGGTGDKTILKNMQSQEENNFNLTNPTLKGKRFSTTISDFRKLNLANNNKE